MNTTTTNYNPSHFSCTGNLFSFYLLTYLLILTFAFTSYYLPFDTKHKTTTTTTTQTKDTHTQNHGFYANEEP